MLTLFLMLHHKLVYNLPHIRHKIHADVVGEQFRQLHRVGDGEPKGNRRLAGDDAFANHRRGSILIRPRPR
ncbi:MAG: hypothetical protein GXY44_06740 [Phycisphaerales bacterium]|nr:hypothetical protein [Phycisphaerales bacterium]